MYILTCISSLIQVAEDGNILGGESVASYYFHPMLSYCFKPP